MKHLDLNKDYITIMLCYNANGSLKLPIYSYHRKILKTTNQKIFYIYFLFTIHIKECMDEHISLRHDIITIISLKHDLKINLCHKLQRSFLQKENLSLKALLLLDNA